MLKTSNFQFSDMLLLTPLFQGIGQQDLQEIIGHTKFGFEKFPAGRTMVKADSACTKLIFLLDGTITATTESADHSYRVEETLSAPWQLQPERLFGQNMRYTSTFRTVTDCSTMFIEKTEAIKLYNSYDVFRLNLLSIFATKLQRAEDRIWAPSPTSLRLRIVSFILHHCLHPAGEKTVKIKMTTLASELGEKRLNISKALNSMAAEGLLSFSRGIIHIPSIQMLVIKSR